MSAPSPQQEAHEQFWQKGAPLESLEGFRSYVTGQATTPAPELANACGAPASAHVLPVEIAHTLPGTETVHVSTHGIAVFSNGKVVAATEPVTDCKSLPSEIVAVHAGFWLKGSAFPNNPHQLVVIDRAGTQTRQHLYYHWPIGKLTQSFTFVLADTAEPTVARTMSLGRDGEEIYTKPYGVFHWEAEQARFVPGQKMNARTRESF